MTDSDALPLRIRALQPGEALRLYPVFHSAVHRLAARHYTPAQCAAWAPLPFDESPELYLWLGSDNLAME